MTTHALYCNSSLAFKFSCAGFKEHVICRKWPGHALVDVLETRFRSVDRRVTEARNLSRPCCWQCHSSSPPPPPFFCFCCSTACLRYISATWHEVHGRGGRDCVRKDYQQIRRDTA